MEVRGITLKACRCLDHNWPLTSTPVQSAGELENDEHTAGVIMQMVRTACRFRLPGSADPCFKRMSGNVQCTGNTQATYDSTGLTCVSPVFLSSVILEDFVYTVTVSGQKVFVVKRQNNQHEPVNVWQPEDSDESHFFFPDPFLLNLCVCIFNLVKDSRLQSVDNYWVQLNQSMLVPQRLNMLTPQSQTSHLTVFSNEQTKFKIHTETPQFSKAGIHLHQWSPTFFAQRTDLMSDNIFTDRILRCDW